MNLASVRRPVSVASACAASGLLLAGLALPGLLLAAVAVVAAWLPTAAPPAD